MWQLVQANGENADYNSVSPTSRSKHATCINQDGFIYLYGGKSGNISLKDLWRFDTENNYWEEIKCTGDHPPSLQEHTMISWNNKIYIFGGEIGYSSQETPLWQLDLTNWTWYKFGSANTNSAGISSTQPTGRSGHSAVLFDNSIYVYGGYISLKGSLQDLWKFDLCTESWSLISGPFINTNQPTSRHYHSSVIYENQMYVYGGMSNLESKSDFWRFCIADKTWYKVKCNKGPGELYGHSAIKAFNCMFIFGGERNGNLLQELWRFNFETEIWDKIQTEGMLPSPRSRHTAITNPFIGLNSWDSASSTISSNNSNQSESNRLSQYNYNTDDLDQNSKEIEKSNKKSDKDAQLKNKENKCDCNRSNEGPLRKFFRKKIGKNKLVRSMSTNSYNISHNENCDFFRTSKDSSSINKTSMKKSNTCYEETIKEQQENCLINSNTIESLATTSSLQDYTTSSNLLNNTTRTNLENQIQDDKNKLNNKNQQQNNLKDEQKIEIRKYDIGQLSCLNSPNEDAEELVNRLDQLKQEFESKTIKTNNLDFLTNNKKPRPKSDLINGLPNLVEDMSYAWDNGYDFRLSDQTYYSLCPLSPIDSPQNKSTNIKLRNRILTNRKPRPKTCYQSLFNYYENDFKDKSKSYLNSDLNDITEIGASNNELFIAEEMNTFVNSPFKENNTLIEIDKNQLIKQNDDDKTNDNSIKNDTNNSKNNSTTGNTTTVCSPMSTSSALCSMSQSLSQSSGYQSFMEDSLLENSNVINVNNQNNTINTSNTNENQDTNQIKLRNPLNQLKLNKNSNERTIKRHSCNLSNFSNFNNYNEQLNNKIDSKENQLNNQTKQSKNFINKQTNKQLPNSSSNVEISVNNQNKLNYQLSNVEHWERKMIVKTYSTNAFNGKDNMYNIKNIQRISNSFLNLSEKVNSLDFNFLIKKKKDRKKKKDKTDYQFCMLIFGGNEKINSNNCSREPISIWKLFV